MAYAAAAAATLSDFSPDVVAYVSDPRTGIAASLKWLPSVAELREACNAEAARRHRLAVSRPIQVQRYASPPLTLEQKANLFVGSENKHYEKLVARHGETGGRQSYHGSSKSDGRTGIWVPREWYAELAGRMV